MLRTTGRRLFLTRRRTATVLGGTAVVGGGTYYFAAHSDQTLGLRRQSQFWSRVMPVVADYYWHCSRSSPWVKYQRWSLQESEHSGNTNGDDDDSDEQWRALREKLLEDLHRKHAPDILQVMLDLKGLYIKLGQVLSVTALPIPDDYRVRFRTLQSDVPGWEEFESAVKPVLEADLGHSLDEIFSDIDPTPCGAASIGQAHRATLRANGQQVIVKVQYPNAAWQVPADIQCVGDFLSICVWFGVVDESAARLSFNEFSRQFLSELDYKAEQHNLQTIYNSSLDETAPYRKHGVVLPQVYPELCSNRIITMSYLPGPKLEQEARRQLESLGIDTSKDLRSLVGTRDKSTDTNQYFSNAEDEIETDATDNNIKNKNAPSSWKLTASKLVGQWVGVDSILWMVRLAKRLVLWSTAAAVQTIQVASTTGALPHHWEEWAEAHQKASQQAERLGLTQQWMEALLDVHGHQIFDLGLFNADCHPGNILVVEDKQDKSNNNKPKLGLIDFGQCKHLTVQERAQVGQLILSVANKESDEQIAAAFRDLGVKTKNDSTKFLAEFAKLMFGKFEAQHLDHAYHRQLHELDRVDYFPKELSMVYRTALLLRGLAVSLQINANIGEQWRHHAETAVQRSLVADRHEQYQTASVHEQQKQQQQDGERILGATTILASS